MAEYVDLSERVSATFYSDEYEEWTQQTVTIADVLDSVCDDYTVLPSAQPERLTNDDFETIRIHLNAYKKKLCNQHRWKEAEEYQRIIDRFMAFASAQPERKPGHWETYIISMLDGEGCRCSECGFEGVPYWNFCPNCGADNMRGEQK